MKKCIKCGEIVVDKQYYINNNNSNSKQKKDTEEEKWKNKCEELVEEKLCPICMERVKNVVLVPCGHFSCSECAATLEHCHMCRTLVERRQNVYS